MAFGVAKALVFLQLSLLFVGSFSAQIDTLIPALPPKVAPGPTLPPKLPPYPKKPLPIVATGVVFVKACEFAGKNITWKATSVAGAPVTMVCKLGGKAPQKYTTKTDKNGFYWLQGPKTSPFNAKRCRVYLEPSNLPNCGKPSPFNYKGPSGVYLITVPTYQPSGFFVYNLGLWTFEPKCPKV